MRWIWLRFLFIFFVANPFDGMAQFAARSLARVVALHNPVAEWNDAFMDVQNLSLPWLEKVEFRSELDRLLFSRQEFMARASFQLPSIRRAEIARLRSYTAWKSSERNSSWFPVLQQTYQSLVDFQASVLDVTSLQTEYQLLMKEDSLYRQILRSGREVDVPDFIALQTEIQDVRSQMAVARLRWIKYAEVVGADTVSPVLDAFWLSPTQMKAMVDSMRVLSSTSSEGELSYLDASYRLVQAESRRWLDFVQSRYTVRDDLLLQNRFSVGIGLVIPWNGSSRQKLADLQFRRVQLQEDERANLAWKGRRLQQFKAEFHSSYAAYVILSGQQEEETIQAMKLKYLQSGRVDPVKWVRLERNELRRRSNMHKELKRLWKSYIDVVDVSGLMYKEPFTNWLYGNAISVDSGR